MLSLHCRQDRRDTAFARRAVAEAYTHHSEGGQYYPNLVGRSSLLSYPNRDRELIHNTQKYARSKSYKLASLLGAELKEEEEEEEVVVKAKNLFHSQNFRGA